MTIKLVFLSDPSHGWARISLKDFIKSGINPDSISHYSYMTMKFIYLEEDRDLSLFLNHCLDNSIDYSVRRNKPVKDRSCIRGYAGYRREFALSPLSVGDRVRNEFSGWCEIVSIKSGEYVRLIGDNGNRYKTRTNSFYDLVMDFKRAY